MAHCQYCKSELKTEFIDLGKMPISNALVSKENLLKKEIAYPLITYVCETCFLVQALDVATPEDHFHENYAYFSSVSKAWVEHARNFVEQSVGRFDLSKKSFVVEIASNDGYLLKNYLPYGIPILGIEPSLNVARAAERVGVPTVANFFTLASAKEVVASKGHADLIVANNVLAHVPNIRDFISGVKHLLKSSGVVSFEFPWLLNLILKNQFDTIYHEHYSYLSLSFLKTALADAGLEIFDVERLETHGGSLRVFCKHQEYSKLPISERVGEAFRDEEKNNLNSKVGFKSAHLNVKKAKFELLKFLIECSNDGKKVVGYGAPAKAATLLNYCGIGTELLPFTVDLSPQKMNKYLPGKNIPILSVEKIFEEKPDYVLIFPWNLKKEIVGQLEAARSWGCKFVTPIPWLEIF